MRDEHHELEDDFYRTCARLLGASYTDTPWTGRGPNRTVGGGEEVYGILR